MVLAIPPPFYDDFGSLAHGLAERHVGVQLSQYGVNLENRYRDQDDRNDRRRTEQNLNPVNILCHFSPIFRTDNTLILPHFPKNVNTSFNLC